MYLNEAFIIGFMSAQQNKALLTVFVIIMSYISAVLFEKIYKIFREKINYEHNITYYGSRNR